MQSRTIATMVLTLATVLSAASFSARAIEDGKHRGKHLRKTSSTMVKKDQLGEREKITPTSSSTSQDLKR